MKTSKTGYLKNSPDVNKPQNIIQGGDITMKGVEFKVLGTDDRGYTKVMHPGYDYKFPGAKYVTETPIKKTNMESNKQEKKNLLNDNPIASHGSWISKHSIAAGSPVHMGGSGKSPLYQDDLRAGEETEFRKAYREQEDMVENPHYGKKIYANPDTGVRVKLDKEASTSKLIPKKVLANLAKATSKGKKGSQYGQFER